MRKGTLIGLTVGAVVALGCGAGSTTATSGGSGNSGGKTAAKTAKVGEAARDGKFEFTVQQVKCGVPSLGNDMLGKKAQGQFCLVTVQVKNIGKEAQAFSDSGQKAFGADKTQYSTDSTAGMYANQDAATLFNQINPGNQVTGVLVYDIPAGATLAKLELHDSSFSGGVDVQLA
ncbi:DUF4352 domain-containing protein [Planosporangium mesophilum]|uniref:DUF4352 domain-containing protein n=1 Tax=Planosporangium mesophilum TaxID=689768 RepID=A0A8J3TAG1_9ACTN|nr:DUF4352 domain-containing protein [Planosporangium mesophilum]NJC83915.1 DUF4352 domain-containing protein [Planosporangium mesophilum]GII22719.1 hypothetical protein Pme01_23160 [Planosporangium mesophilum]